jgi:ATP-dependent helicase/nuclease subunit A
VYDDTRYPAHAGALPGGAIRQANLRLLMERAIQYEETTMKGLFHFMRFIEGLQSSGGAGSVSAAQASHLASDRVRIMTVHKAKGLEFPIVFVSMLGKKFNREDERKNVILHPKYGLGLTYTDLEKRTKSNTLARYACARLMRRENLSEELRVLYVAMTRAKEQLILTGCVSGFEKKTARWSAMASGGETLLPLYCRRDADTFLDWLIPCLARHRDGFILRGDNGEKNRAGDALYSHPASFNLRLTKAGDILLPDAAVQPSEAVNALTLTPSPYPYEITVPSKLSISEIKRIFASDVTPDSTAYHENREPKFDPPDFIRETQGMDARRMGTAMHTVAEHTDVHTHRNAAAIDGLLTNLVARNLLTGEEANAIDPGKIETFMNSLLAKRMRAAARLYREIPFVMEIPAREIYGGESGETLLVHGIIDCYFEEDGGIVLVDYKSDAVYGNPYSWANTHRVQLDIYKKAVEQSTAKEVKEVLLYSFWLGEALTMENL